MRGVGGHTAEIRKLPFKLPFKKSPFKKLPFKKLPFKKGGGWVKNFIIINPKSRHKLNKRVIQSRSTNTPFDREYT